MSNHVHFVAVPKAATSLGLAFRDAHAAYAAYFNRTEDVSGHLWQGRYFSCAMDDSHLWAAVRYIERNPVRAGVVKKAADYAWSSAQAHCGLRADPLLSKDFPPEGVVRDWSAWLSDEDVKASDAIRRHSHVGRPCGNEPFIDRLEILIGRHVRRGKPGPARK